MVRGFDIPDDSEAINYSAGGFGEGILVAENEHDCANSNWNPETQISEPDDDDSDHLWSIVGLPSRADDVRSEWPAHPDGHTQVGHSKLKSSLRDAPHWADNVEDERCLLSVFMRACRNFE